MNASSVATSPQTIDHFVGAKQIVERVKVALEASWNAGNGCVFPHTLALGAGGLGKTEISRIIAREMGVELVEVLGQTLKSTAELNAALLQAEGGCLLIDEAHSLSDGVQVSLLKVLQEGMIFLDPMRNGGKAKAMTLKPFCLIAATTDEYALTKPLIDRFRLILRFDYYSVEDLTTLLGRTRGNGRVGVLKQPMPNSSAASSRSGSPMPMSRLSRRRWPSASLTAPITNRKQTSGGRSAPADTCDQRLLGILCPLLPSWTAPSNGRAQHRAVPHPRDAD